MTPENQALLNAIRGIVEQAVAPLAERVDALTEPVDALAGHVDALTERMTRLESQVETIDTRTNQMAGDLLDLRDRIPLLEERVDNGFRALKSDLNFAFSDARKASTTQRGYEKAIDGLRQELTDIQQRLAALERSQGAS